MTDFFMHKLEFAPYSTLESLAMQMYDDYCAAVGGKAYDGRPLPTAEEFFSDDSKAKQVRGWLAAAGSALAFVLNNQHQNAEQ